MYKDFVVDFDSLDALEELAGNATPGPWVYFPKTKYNEHHVTVPIEGRTMQLGLFEDGCQTERPEADAKFIAGANPQTVLALTRFARSAKRQLDSRTVTGHEKLIKHLVAVLKDADASLRKVTREGTQYDAMDIHVTLTTINHAIETVEEAGVNK